MVHKEERKEKKKPYVDPPAQTLSFLSFLSNLGRKKNVSPIENNPSIFLFLTPFLSNQTKDFTFSPSSLNPDKELVKVFKVLD